MNMALIRSCLLAVLLLSVSRGAFALTGDELLKQCTAADQSMDRRLCESYINGALSGANMIMVGMKMLYPDASSYPTLFCVNPSTPTSKLVSAVVEYLRGHPQARRYDAGSEVLLAFRKSFPCD